MEKETNMDARLFASTWVKPEDLRDGPIVATILQVLMNDKFNPARPMLELSNGQQFTLFERNIDILIKAWGFEMDEWPGYEVELSHESYTIRKPDGSKEEKDGAKICAISPRKPPKDGNGGGLPMTREELRKKNDDDMADSIPF
jgi:hypothetical protein